MFESLDRSEVNRAQLKITALSSGGSFLDGYDISVVSIAILELRNQFSLTSGDSTLLLGSTLIGMIFGGIIMGYLTDLRGRRSLYLLDMLLFITFTVLSAVSTSFIEVLVFRILLGVAIGADYAISPTIIAEFSPSRHRGKLLTINGMAWFLGAASSFAIGAVMTPLGPESWRYMFLIGVIPAAIVLFMRVSIPESPRWLLENGRPVEARESLQKIGVSEFGASSFQAVRTSFRTLFARQYLPATIFMTAFWFCLDATTYVIGLNGPSILVAFGLTSFAAARTASMIAFVSIIGAIFTLMLVDRIGRKMVTTIGFAGMVATLIGAAYSIQYSRSLFLLITFLTVFEIIQEFGPGITNSVYPQELFPTNIRATAQGFGTTMSRIGAIMGIFLFSAISQPLGYAAGMVFLSLVSLIGLVVTVSLGIETKGRSLENITAPQNLADDQVPS